MAGSYDPDAMKRLAQLLAIRPGEGPLIALVATVFATAEAARGFGEIGADTLFLSRFGAGALPYLYVLLGFVSLAVALGYGAAIGRLRLGALFVGLLGGFVVVLVILRLALMTGAPLVLPVTWLTVYVLGAVLVTLVWTLGGSLLDARQAKRLFPLCTSAAILGGFAGTLAAGPLARLAGTENLLLADAALLAVAASITARVAPRIAARPAAPSAERASLTAELRAGYDYVRRSPLMRLVAVAYLLFAVLYFAVTFPFMRAIAGAFRSEADLATALGLLSAAVTAASFVVSIALANRVFARFGVASAALVLPLVYLAGFGLWIVQFTLATAVVFRFAQQVAQRGLSNAAWSAFYNTVPAERRPQVLAFNDGVPGQLGIALSGLLLIAAGSFLAPNYVFWLGAAAALALTWVVLQIRRRYADTLVRTLRAGLAEQVLEGGPGLGALGRDPRVIEHLRAALTDPSAGVRRLSADLLGRLGAQEAIDSLMGLLEDQDPSVRSAGVVALAKLPLDGRGRAAVEAASRDPDAGVRASAVRALAVLDPAAVEREADRLTGDPSPRVRAELSVALVEAGQEDRPHAILGSLLESRSADDRIAGLQAVERLGGHSPSPRMALLLDDPSPRVRAAAVGAIAAVVDPGLPDPLPSLVAALDDQAPSVRLAAAHGLNGRGGRTSEALLEVLRTGTSRAQDAALRALDGRGLEVREELLAWAGGQVGRAGALRERSAALGPATTHGEGASAGPGDSSSAEFLRALLRRREWQIEQRLLTALAVLGAPAASGLIRRCLRANDPQTRAQAIEALDSLGDRTLSREIVRLLESDPQPGSGDSLVTLQALSEDQDPWVRALATHALSAWLAREWRTITERASRDPEAVVRSIVSEDGPDGWAGASARGEGGAGGGTMPQTGETLSEIDRILFLRRVPLFGELDPEDLQRIASSAIERFYPGGQAVVREGELGDELVVLVEGSVFVVRGEGEEARVLRTYEAGDHIGELAVLRERPRAATVVAQEPGVRGLVIDGESLRAILRERPEAAMAMLA
ncbi:MAG: cyclic nucleotide-binding domain-containing protein, partial [Chloroflexi bacterium]